MAKDVNFYKEFTKNFGTNYLDENVFNAVTGNNIWNSFFGSNGLFTNPEGAWDKFKNGNASDIARENLQYQKDTLDYQKALQQQVFEREDNSYARTVADMRMSGLNPVSMNGTNGAGEVISTETPQNNMNDTSNLQAIGTIFNAIQQAISTGSNSSLQSANANLLNAQAENQRIKNIYESDLLSEALRSSEYDNWYKSFNNYKEHLNYTFNQNMGWTDNMPDWYKMSSLLSGNKGFSYDHADISKFRSYANSDGSRYWLFNGSDNNNPVNLSQAATDFRKNQLVNMLFSLPQMLFNFIK